MSDLPVASPRPTRERVAAWATDVIVVAYGLWALDDALARMMGDGNASARTLLAQRPLLWFLAPLLAAAWEIGGRSAGQLAFRLSALDEAGRPAAAAARATAAFVRAGLSLLPLLVGVLGGATAEAWQVAVGVAAVFAVAPLCLADRRSWPERLAGLRYFVVRASPVGDAIPWTKRSLAWVGLGLFVLTMAIGLHRVAFSPAALWEGAERAGNLMLDLVSFDFSILPEATRLLLETVFIAFLASVLAIPFAFVLAFAGARNVTGSSWAGRLLYGVARASMNVTRSIEPLVWALIFSVWVKVGPFAGCLALWIHSVAALAKLYSESIEGIDPGPVEAMRATGARHFQVLRYGVVPQVISPFLGFTVYRWDINVRMATVIGLVGGGGIGAMLIYYNQVGQWPKVGTLLLLITAVVWIMDALSSKARAHLK